MRKQWKQRFFWNTILLALLLLGNLSSAVAVASRITNVSGEDYPTAQEEAQLRVQTLAADRMLLELSVPSFQMDEIGIDGKQHVALSAPGLDDSVTPGQPQLPHKGALLGLPPTGGWSVRIVDVERETVQLAHSIKPARPFTTTPPSSFGNNIPLTEFSLAADESAYASDAFFPSSLLDVGDPVLLRDLRVARLGLNPFRYNPARRELEHVRHLVVEISFEKPTTTQPVISDRWDPILEQTVLNYDMARAWRGVHPATNYLAQNPPAIAQGSFKVEVDADGLYQLTYVDLLAAGFPVDTADPRNLRLFLEGKEVAIQVAGEANGKLDPGDRILFYGQAAQTRFTGTHVYWLTQDGVPGLRMTQRDVDPTSGYPSAPGHQTTRHFEENHLYDSVYPEADGDHWYWTDLGFLQTDCPLTAQIYNFDIPSLSSGVHSVTLQTSLQGYTPGTHNLAAQVNGQPIGDLIWSGASRYESGLTFQSSLLQAGQNELRLENGNCPPPPPPSPPPNGTYLNYFEVSYEADHITIGDALSFEGKSGKWQYNLEGFATSEISLFDISNPSTPVHLVGGKVEPGYRLEFQDETGQSNRYLALSQVAILSPSKFYVDTPSNLTSPTNRADYLLIGYGEFLAATQPLLALRASQGLQVAAVDVQDVYDEFSYGMLNPQAIRDFLAYAATEWQLAPIYVLLVGDGTIDYRNHLGNGWHNFVPAFPAKVDPWLGETASDNQLASVLGNDSLPDLHLGRLTVSSVQETADVVAKIVAYETTPMAGEWNQQVLFVADDTDFGGDFAALSNDLYDEHLPAPFAGTRVYLAQQPDEPYEYDPTEPTEVESARAALQSQLDAGKLLTTFFGHSSHSQWALEILLHRDHVPDLRNGRRLPVVLSMTCYTGAFHHPPYAPLDERLLVEPVSGAVATWGPTGAGITAGHYYLAQGFFDTVFDQVPNTLGAATSAGKIQLYISSPVAAYLIDTYALLGDPAMFFNLDMDTPYYIYLPLVTR